ncbi:hypothetical protein HanHA89_Chr15g0629261 [Helianthus annuus]|nr:hypothetical protein HanHA89_Chr15g0629261 [Helianthus annuus]
MQTSPTSTPTLKRLPPPAIFNIPTSTTGGFISSADDGVMNSVGGGGVAGFHQADTPFLFPSYFLSGDYADQNHHRRPLRRHHRRRSRLQLR